MLDWVKIYVTSLATFLVIDAIWLGVTARTFYRQRLGFLLAEHPHWWAAATFYLLFVGGMQVFVIAPAIDGGTVGRVALRGALFGLVTYATYDLTNQATIKGWPWVVTVVDLAWGMLLCSIVCSIGFLVATFIRQG
ncbi:MAG: membrane protein [Pirellulaceae bacterium]|nr:MAG: membrane protein [Pirellulaceae bacterium]